MRKIINCFVVLFMILANFGSISGARASLNIDYEAEWVGQSEYQTLVQGQEADVWVEFRNIGQETWYKNGNNPIHLGTTNKIDRKSVFYESTSWITDNRIEMSSEKVRPGEIGRFEFKIKAPYTNGVYNEYFRPVAENVSWMQDQGVYWQFRVIGSQGYEEMCVSKDSKVQDTSQNECVRPESWMYDARWVAQSDYLTLRPGQTGELWVEFENKGTATWYQTGDFAIHLGTANPLDRESIFAQSDWLSSNRVVMTPVRVAPGQKGRFTFKIKAPQKTGEYHEYFRPVAENVTWLRDEGVYWTIKVTGDPVSDNNQNDSDNNNSDDNSDNNNNNNSNNDDPIQNIPYAVKILSQSDDPYFDSENMGPVELQVKIKNLGQKTWNKSGTDSVQLGTSQPYDRNSGFMTSSWLSTNRIAMDQDMVKSGETASFTFKVQPGKMVDQGTHQEHFMLVVNNNQWLTESEIFWDMVLGQPRYMTVGSQGSYMVREGKDGAVILNLNAADAVKVKYAGGKYQLTYGNNTKYFNTYPRFESKEKGGVMKLISYQDVKSWDNSLSDNLFRDTLEIRYSSAKNRLWAINELSLEDYVAGVAETSDSSPYEFIKALIIAERTYAYYHVQNGGRHPEDFSDVFNSVNGNGDDQVYRGYGFEKRNPDVARAVLDTKGMVVKYNGEVVVTPYFSHSDGHTRSFEEVWGSKKYPYCVSVPDPYNEGMELFGHGVGMSALGAMRFAEKENKTYDWILKYYYKGIEIGKVDTSATRIRVGIYSISL